MTKIDIIKPDEIRMEDQERIKSVSQGDSVILLPMSTISEEGVSIVKQAACEALLQHRTQIKLKGKHIQDVANRIHLALPVKRDDKERPPVVIETMDVRERSLAQQRQQEWENQQNLYLNFDPEYKGVDFRERYDLEDPEWRFDAIPEIMDGKNVLDFWAPDVAERLTQLEREEQARVRRVELEMENEEDIPGLSEEQMAKVKRIRVKRTLMIQESRAKKGTDNPRMPMKYSTDPSKDLTTFQEHLDSLGLDGKEVTARIRARSKSRPRSELSRSASQSRMGRKRTRSELESRGLSVSRSSANSFKDEKQKSMAERLAKRARKELSRDGRLGESDRHVFDLKPKHLFSGKRGIGSTDRR